jgi:hypothetical protein
MRARPNGNAFGVDQSTCAAASPAGSATAPVLAPWAAEKIQKIAQAKLASLTKP